MTIQTKIDKAVYLIIVTVVFYAIVLFIGDINVISEKILEIEFWYLPAILALMGVHTVLMGIRYHRLLHRLEIKIPFTESLKIFVAGLSLGVTPGGIGTALKSHILKKKYGNSISSSLPIILIERWTELLAILIISLALLLWVPLYESMVLLAVGFALIVFVMVVFSNSKVFLLVQRLCGKIRFFKKFTESIEESKNSLNKITKKESIIESLVYSLIAKSIHLFTVYLVFLSIGINLSFFESGQIYYTSLVFGVLTFIPGGIIVTESSMLGLLLKHGIEMSLAIVAVIYIRIISMWLVTFVGTVMLKFSFRTKEQSNT